jgi:hypothetical protein
MFYLSFKIDGSPASRMASAITELSDLLKERRFCARHLFALACDMAFSAGDCRRAFKARG